MSQRNTVIEQHKTDLQLIHTSNGYVTDVRKVLRGIHFPEDLSERPAIAFWCEGSEPQYDRFSTARTRRLTITLWAYVDCKPDDYEKLDNISADIEKFLESSDNTYETETIIGSMRFYEGGSADPIGILEMEYTIDYDYVSTSP